VSITESIMRAYADKVAGEAEAERNPLERARLRRRQRDISAMANEHGAAVKLQRDALNDAVAMLEASPVLSPKGKRAARAEAAAMLEDWQGGA
jgi:hypothetical protein